VGKSFATDIDADYLSHYVERHRGKPAYPGKADLEHYGLQAQGKGWER
jgi:hypothetical protein